MTDDMSYAGMMRFAEIWVANWNRRDVEAVLSHFAEDAVFTSPLAARYAGRPELRGKAELGGYWRAALARIERLHFVLDHAAWDAERRELTVLCEADINGERKRACEIMTFDPAGRQIRGEALYGAVL